MDAFKLVSCVCLLAAGAMQVSGMEFNCTDYNGGEMRPCTLDLNPHCLTNGTTVFGNCAAKKAVCEENAVIDKNRDACEYKFDCPNFNPMVCTKDTRRICLKNGTIVVGTCAAKKAVCLEEQGTDKSNAACQKSTATQTDTNNQTGDDGDDSSAATFTASTALFFTMLFLNKL